MRSHNELRDTQLNSSKNVNDLQRGSFSRSEKSLLGTTTKSASTPTNIDTQDSLIKTYDNNESRYALQKIAQSYHPNSRVCSCMKTIAPTQNAVKVVYDDSKRHAHYQNLMRCDSVWLCPVCAGRITSRRADEIRQGYAYAVDTLKYRVVMVTYTMQHGTYHKLIESLNAMRDARRKMRSGRKWQKYKSNYGYRGCISALEVTWGSESGWHVHVHEIQFLDPETADFELHPDNSKLEEWLHNDLSPHWIESLKTCGRSASFANGLSVDATDKYVAEYIAKQGKLPTETSWDIALELTKSNHKISKNGLHPFQILGLSDSDMLTDVQCALYKSLWYEYAEAFVGRRQIYWTDGLKDLLLVDVIEDDADIEETGEVIFLVAREMWRDLVYLDKRGELLNKTIYHHGDVNQINQWFASIADQAYQKRKNNDHWRKI